MKTAGTHFARIDVLRGIAIFAVFIHHYWLGIAHNPRIAEAMQVANDHRALFGLHEFGYLGVKLFFVISGFCIHHSYLNWRRKHAGSALRSFIPAFLQRRFWRILPPYAVVLVILFVLKYDDLLSARAAKHFLVHLSLTNTLVPGFFYNLDPAFWSIAVEWQLYLIYPLILVLALKWGWRTALAAAVACTVVFRLALPHVSTAPVLLNLPFAWWYDWVIGAVVADAFSKKKQVFRSHGLLILASGLVGAWSLVYGHVALINALLPPLFFAVIMEASIWSGRPLAKGERSLAALGVCSYSFYLLHGQITYLFTGEVLGTLIAGGSWMVWTAGCAGLFVALLGLSTLSYRVLELQSVRLGERLHRKPAVLEPVEVIQTPRLEALK